METASRIAFDCLRREGVTLERIAGLSKTCSSAVRLWQQGVDIPKGAATRLIVAARVVVALKVQPAPDLDDSHHDELAEFAKRWLASHVCESTVAVPRSLGRKLAAVGGAPAGR